VLRVRFAAGTAPIGDKLLFLPEFLRLDAAESSVLGGDEVVPQPENVHAVATAAKTAAVRGSPTGPGRLLVLYERHLAN
jgi:hypothetical protein